jgi:hypothetical protein
VVYQYNKRFTCISGKRYWDAENGLLKFTEGVQRKLDGTYRFVWGGATFKADIYGNNNLGMSQALKRLTALRPTKVPWTAAGFSEHLFENQAAYFADIFPIEQLAHLVAPGLKGFKGAFEEALLHYNDAHPKRALRIQGWEEAMESGDNLDGVWLRDVLYKMKKDEIAKPGKYSRGIGDLGVLASLLGAFLCKKMKTTLQESLIEFNGGHVLVVNIADATTKDFIFENLMNPKGKWFAAVFSDDSCYSIRDEHGEVHMFNLDISKCDTSHGPSVFKAFEDLHPPGLARTAAKKLVDQLRLPFRVVSLVNPKEKVLLSHEHPILASGSSITTCINDLANLAIIHAISAAGALNEAQIIEAAEQTGYILTAEHCPTYHSLQFLKHSPVRATNGEMTHVLNIGVMLRTAFSCRGDLPGKGPLKARADFFQKNLLQGLYPSISFDLVNRMKSLVAHATGDSRCTEQVRRMMDARLRYRHVSQGTTLHVDDDELYRRYSLNELEKQELTDFGDCQYGEFRNNTALAKVLHLDYGLKMSEFEGGWVEPPFYT